MYKFADNIFSLLRQERDDFLYNEIEIVDGYQYSQYDTVKKVHKYYNSQFDGSNYEEINGVKRKKIFNNINKWRCMVATKMIDVDTKHVKVIPENPNYEINTMLLEKELDVWMKGSEMGEVLNELAENLPVYGSVVLRKRKGGADIIDLRNFYCDQASKTLDKSRYKIIKHELTPEEMREKRGIWDGVDEAINKYASHSSQSYERDGQVNKVVGVPYIKVYERFGQVPLSWFTNKEKDENEYVNAWYIVAGVDDCTKDNKGDVTQENGTILYKKQIKEDPLKEFHYSKTPGRWLGVGVVEDTFEAQREVNKVKNMESKALELSALTILQTADDQVVSNVMSDLENGDIIRTSTQGSIQKVDVNSRNTGEFGNISQNYEVLADRQTFSYDVVRGEGSPASATLGAIQLQAQQAGSVYDFKREKIGLELVSFFKDLVFPELKKQKKSKHYLRFTGTLEERDKLINKFADIIISNAVKEGNPLPDRDKIVSELKSRENLWVNVQKDFYENIDYNITLTITGENTNIGAELQNVNYVLGLIARDERILQNPVIKRLLFKLMSKLGMNVTELDMLMQETNQAPQLQGQPQEQPQLSQLPA